MLRLATRVLFGSSMILAACSGTPTSSTPGTELSAGGATSNPSNQGGNSVGGASAAGTGTGGGTATGGSPPLVTPKASCANLAANCQGESCCTSIVVPGGSFPMGRGPVGATDYYEASYNDDVEHPATVSTFELDKYEVTVGRFREFVNAYDTWHQSHIVEGEGQGTAPKTGFDQNDNANLPFSALALKNGIKCHTNYTWTDAVDTHENLPINCVTWYEAFAFCVYDGGRLPTEAEWEYAAAGGAENRLYPWGLDGPNTTLANCCGEAVQPVGSKPTGNGLFGQADLAGSMVEWVFDAYQTFYYGTVDSPVACVDCANPVANLGNRVLRGGSYFDSRPQYLPATYRFPKSQGERFIDGGFRCARNVK